MKSPPPSAPAAAKGKLLPPAQNQKPNPATAKNAPPGRPLPSANPKFTKSKIPGIHFFGIDPVPVDVVANEEKEKVRCERAFRLITMQNYIIAGLSLVLVLGQPAFQPIYQYYATDGQNHLPLVGLTMPNLNNNAILSWAESSVTEVMTIGFGDFERQLLAQKTRFTPVGWNSFVKSFLGQHTDEKFRKNQLVLTSVPNGTPEILSQGVNPDHVYQWKIKIPVIMTYTTNDNVKKPQHALVTLTIVRSKDTPGGVAIETWGVNSLN